jgi:GT2 family glycosyltransferase
LTSQIRLVLPTERLYLAVIVPAFNRWNETADCLERLIADGYQEKIIILVDDGSSDGTAEQCRERFPEVTILSGDGNLWWSGAINLGVEEALRRGADLILWLNNDNLVEPETIPSLVDLYRDSPLRTVICAENRSTATGELEWAGAPPFWHPEAAEWRDEQSDEATKMLRHPPGGRGVLLPAICFREVGKVDQDRFPHYWADHDFHYRAMGRGYQYQLARGATVWNRPNPPRFGEQEPFTLAWSWSYLTSRRSPMNLVTLHRLWRRHLSGPAYRQIFGGYIRRTLIWILTGMIARHQWLHGGLRRLRRYWLEKTM